MMDAYTPPRHAEIRLKTACISVWFYHGAYLEMFWALLPDPVVDNNRVSRVLKTTLVWFSSDHTLHLIKTPTLQPLDPPSLQGSLPLLAFLPSFHPSIPLPPLLPLVLLLPPPSLPSPSHPATGQHEPRTPETLRRPAPKSKTNRSCPCPPLRSTSSRYQPPAPPHATISPLSAPPT